MVQIKYGANKEMTFVLEGMTPTSVVVTYKLGESTQMITELPRKAILEMTLPVVDECFEVKSVVCGGVALRSDGDVYKTPALEEDTEIVVTYEYAGTVLFDFTSGVDTVDGCDLKVYTDDDKIVIEGVTAGAEIRLYTVNGLLLASGKATDTIARIAVEPGVYIVTVDGVALKVRH